MQLFFFTTLCMIISFVAGAEKASDSISQEIQFLTVLVGDFKSHGRDYVDYIRTAQNVPPEVTQLALKVATYTNNAYTTMLTDSNINVASLRSFATQLPWYTRILQELAAAGAGATTTGSGSSATGSSTTASSSHTSSAGVGKLAPCSAILGFVALLLL